MNDQKLRDQINTIYTKVVDSITFDQVDVRQLTLIELPLKLYQDGTFSFALEYPYIWDEITFNEKSNWYEVFSDTKRQAIYIYPVFGVNSAEDIAETMVEEHKLRLESPIEPTSFQGYEAATFDISYKFNGEWYGRAIAVNFGGYGLVFSIDILDNTASIDELFEHIISHIQLPIVE